MPNTVSLTAPTDYSVELASAERRRRLAELMQQQSAVPLDTNQMAGGYVIPVSPLAGAAKMLQAYSGHRLQEQADEKQRDVAKRYQSDLIRVLNEGAQQEAGTPGRPSLVDPQEAEQSADQGTPMPPDIGAVAPDPMRAAQTYMTHPATQGMGMQEMQRQRMMQAFGLTNGYASTEQAGGPGAPTVGATGGTVQGIPRNLAMSLMMADPTGKLLAQEIAKLNLQQSKPIPIAEGGGLFSADGKQIAVRPRLGENVLPITDEKGAVIGVKPMPGAAEAAAGMTAATERAKAGLDLVPVPQSDGSTVTMPRSRAVDTLGGGQPAAPQRAPQPDPLAGRPPAEQAAIRQVMEASRNGQGLSVSVPNAGPIPSSAVLGTSQTPAEKTRGEAQARADVERSSERPQANQAMQGADLTLDNVIREGTALLNAPGLYSITGPVMGRLSSVAPNSTNAQARLDTLKAQIGTQVLAAMREASKTGGAVGNVTEKEWPILQNQLGALQQAQTTTQFKSNLKDVLTTLERMRGIVRQGYADKYPNAPKPANPQDDPLGLFR